MICASTHSLLILSAVALSLPLTVAGNAAFAQQPNQSLIQQQIQPMNQPQNLIQGQNQVRSQIQNQIQNQNQSLTQSQNQNIDQNRLPDGTGNSFSPPPLHGLNQSGSATVNESATAPTPQGAASSVESFFQVAPPAQNTNPTTANQHSKTYKFLWHFLDNIGMPMFGNHDPDLAPSLTSPFVMPPAASETVPVVGTPVRNKPTIIDAQAAAHDPSQMAPDDSAKASFTSGPTSNPQ